MEGKPAHLEGMSKEHWRECEESNIVRFHAQEEFDSQPKTFRPCPAFLSSAEHHFLQHAGQDHPWYVELITCAGLHERRDCEVRAALPLSSRDTSHNCCFTSRREWPCLWRKLFPAPRLCTCNYAFISCHFKGSGIFFHWQLPDVASAAISLSWRNCRLRERIWRTGGLTGDPSWRGFLRRPVGRKLQGRSPPPFRSPAVADCFLW